MIFCAIILKRSTAGKCSGSFCLHRLVKVIKRSEGVSCRDFKHHSIIKVMVRHWMDADIAHLVSSVQHCVYPATAFIFILITSGYLSLRVWHAYCFWSLAAHPPPPHTLCNKILKTLGMEQSGKREFNI